MDDTLLSEDRVGNWLQTYTGKAFYPLDPRPEDICIEDIAHALSNICRYGGHCSEYFSVAQHCVVVSRLVPEGMEMWGLLHDASEAYLVDIPRPVKEYLSDYNTIETVCMNVIAEKFGLTLPIPEEVKMADNAALKIEREKLMKKADKCLWSIDALDIDLPWYGNYMSINLITYTPSFSKYYFLERYKEILENNSGR